MPAFAALSLGDGQTPAVSHTFSPQSLTDQLAKWASREGNYAIGFPRASVSTRQNATDFRVTTKIELPVLETLSGGDAGYAAKPKVAYTPAVHTDYVLPLRSSIVERQNVQWFSISFQQNAVMKSIVENFEAVY